MRLQTAPTASVGSIPNPEFVRDLGQRSIRGIQRNASHECGRNEVRVDPSDATTEQAPCADEINHLSMWDCPRVTELLVQGQRSCASRGISDQQLGEDHLVPQHLLIEEKSIDRGSKGLLSRERPYPNRRVHEDH